MKTNMDRQRQVSHSPCGAASKQDTALSTYREVKLHEPVVFDT
jgi:hypothetical protein